MTEPNQDEADRPHVLALLAPLRRRWPVMLVMGLAGAVGGYLGYLSRSPVYESAAVLHVSKRAAAGGPVAARGVYVEDYAATMTHVIASDPVLGEAGRTLARLPLTAPVPDDETARIDALRRALTIGRTRDTGVMVGASSVFELTFAGGTPDDAKLALDAVLEAVRWYLVTRYEDAHARQVAELDRALAARGDERRNLEEARAAKRRELVAVTEEDLAIVRDRVTANAQRGFALQLELIAIERELKAIAAAGASPQARQEKYRELTATAPAAAPPGSTDTLRELVALRAELAERLVAGHPRLTALDDRIETYRRKADGAAPAATADALGRHEARVRERKAVAELQRDRIESRVTRDVLILHEGGNILQAAESLHRQLEEAAVETNRLRDARSALVLAKDSSRTYDVQVLDHPRAGRKLGPSLKLWLLPGVVLGLLAGAGLVSLAEFRDQSFRTPVEIRRRLGVPVFGHIPTLQPDPSPDAALFPDGYDPILVTALRPKSIEAEMYRGVRTRVLVAAGAAKHRVIQVTSPNPGDGKSTTAANLAVSMAQAGKRVLLVDADFRRPRVHALFAVADPELGLGSVLDGTADLADVVRPCGVDRLLLLPAGSAPENPADALAGVRFAAALSVVRDRFDHIIIDSPPLFAFSDPLVIAQRADAVILVFGLTRRSRPDVERAKAHLSDTGAVVLGVVINGQGGPRVKYEEAYKPYVVNKTLRDFSGDGSGSLSGTLW